MHNGSAPCGIEELTYLWCHCIRWKNPITKYFELTTWSIWCTSFISWEAAFVTTHLSDINSKSTTCSEESTAIPSFLHIGFFPVYSCRGGKKILYSTANILQTARNTCMPVPKAHLGNSKVTLQKQVSSLCQDFCLFPRCKVHFNIFSKIAQSCILVIRCRNEHHFL